MMEPLILPMMMFGKMQEYVKEKDPVSGKWKTVYQINKRGKKVAKKKWVEQREQEGDLGWYPSVNHIYDNDGRGGKQLSKMAINLFDRWSGIARSWAEENCWKMTTKEKVVIEITAIFPDHKIRDTNNVMKLMMDSLEEVIFDNDYYALPRIMDFHVIDPKKSGEKPHFILNIYKKSLEDELAS